jgi:hypothetical protein
LLDKGARLEGMATDEPVLQLFERRDEGKIFHSSVASPTPPMPLSV